VKNRLAASRLLVLLSLVIVTGACNRHDPIRAAERLLAEGKTREALDCLAAVPWSSPQVGAARRLIATTCARVPLIRGASAQPPVRVELMEVVDALPHDASCYTEGLELDGEHLIESCGLYKQSLVRRTDLRTGKVLAESKLDRRYFGEGLTRLGNEIFVLTFAERTAFVFDAQIAAARRTFPIQGEGWGLTHAHGTLVMSNGSNELRFLDPSSGRVLRTVSVFNGDVPLMNLNELEYVDGEILANVWLTDRIARIDAASGRVIGWILAEGLLPDGVRFKAGELNGIAYDASAKRLLVTGKRWPHVFLVQTKVLAL
jgi:glutamine cyclotransferase